MGPEKLRSESLTSACRRIAQSKLRLFRSTADASRYEVAENVTWIQLMSKAFFLRVAFTSLVLSMIASCATTPINVTGARVTEAGIYDATIKSTTSDPTAAGSRRNVIEDFKRVKETTIIPAKEGVRFGFRYRIQGAPEDAKIVLNMRHTHPAITDPSTGIAITQSNYDLKSWIGDTYTSFKMEKEWEVVTGEWIFQIWYQNEKLLEQRFTTVDE